VFFYVTNDLVTNHVNVQVGFKNTMLQSRGVSRQARFWQIFLLIRKIGYI